MVSTGSTLEEPALASASSSSSPKRSATTTATHRSVQFEAARNNGEHRRPLPPTATTTSALKSCLTNGNGNANLHLQRNGNCDHNHHHLLPEVSEDSRVPRLVSFAEDEVIGSANGSASKQPRNSLETAAGSTASSSSEVSKTFVNNNNNNSNSSINSNSRKTLGGEDGGHHQSNPHFPRQVKFEATIVMGDQRQHVTIAEELNERVSPSATEGQPPPPTDHADSYAQTVPQVMVSYEQYPPVEDHAFRTKIDGSYEGWDNPFRPDGEISHEAEELLKQWKRGTAVGGGGEPEVPEDELDNDSKAASNSVMKNGSSSSKVIEVRRDNLPHMNSPKPVNLESAMTDIEAASAMKDPKKKKQGCCSIM